ncbi:hypothetical protein MRX96_027998 [Rhipicephalus microplus]
MSCRRLSYTCRISRKRASESMALCKWFAPALNPVRGFEASMEQNAVTSETSGQLGADSHGKEERVDGDKAFKMRDGAVCGDIAEINKPLRRAAW